MSKKEWDWEIINKFWLFGKYPDLLLTEYDYIEFRELIVSNTKLEYCNDSYKNQVFNWDGSNCYSFYYDFEGCEKIISDMLKSTLTKNVDVYVEMPENIPVIKCNSAFFMNNWYDFVRANNFMGTIVCTCDFKKIIEFTDDEKYLLFSNFKIN